jgi:hypothetical protein
MIAPFSMTSDSYRSPAPSRSAMPRGTVIPEISWEDSPSGSRKDDSYRPRCAYATGDLNGDGRAELLEEKQRGGKREILAHFFSPELQEEKKIPLSFGELKDPLWELKGQYRQKLDGQESFLLFQSRDRQKILFKKLQLTSPGESIILHDALQGRDIAGTCDYYGRHSTDLICRSSDGKLHIMIMDGFKVKEERNYPESAALSPEWTIIGAGRFHPPTLTGPLADAYGDIASQHSDGTEKLSLYEGTFLESEHILCPGDFTAGEQMIAIGDMNADGQSDILYRKKDGSVYVAVMDNLDIKNLVPLLGPGE